MKFKTLLLLLLLVTMLLFQSIKADQDVNNEIKSVQDGSIEPKSIIGNDDRYKTPPYKAPHSAIMALKMGIDTNGSGTIDSWFVGTGFLVNSDVMLTAGHNMFIHPYGQVIQMRIYPLQDSSTYGSNYYFPLRWYYPADFEFNNDKRYDWCVVKLQDPLGFDYGWMPYRLGSEYDMTGAWVTVSGYPGDHLGYQYSCQGRINWSGVFSCQYKNDTYRGNSGSPVYDRYNVAFAIHTRGYQATNEANLITLDVYAKILKYSN